MKTSVLPSTLVVPPRWFWAPGNRSEVQQIPRPAIHNVRIMILEIQYNHWFEIKIPCSLLLCKSEWIHMDVWPILRTRRRTSPLGLDKNKTKNIICEVRTHFTFLHIVLIFSSCFSCIRFNYYKYQHSAALLKVIVHCSAIIKKRKISNGCNFRPTVWPQLLIR